MSGFRLSIQGLDINLGGQCRVYGLEFRSLGPASLSMDLKIRGIEVSAQSVFVSWACPTRKQCHIAMNLRSLDKPFVEEGQKHTTKTDYNQLQDVECRTVSGHGLKHMLRAIDQAALRFPS